MHPDDKIPVRVVIGDKIYPLKVARRDEEFIRAAAILLNRRMDEFKPYEGGDIKDRLTWAALDFTTEWVRLNRNREQLSESIENELGNLEDLLQGI